MTRAIVPLRQSAGLDLIFDNKFAMAMLSSGLCGSPVSKSSTVIANCENANKFSYGWEAASSKWPGKAGETRGELPVRCGPDGFRRRKFGRWAKAANWSF